MTKVAVYGTLRRGGGNHRLLENAKFEGLKKVGGFNLYMLGPVVPGIRPGGGCVTVETYSEHDLEALDALEGHPTMYKRTLVHIEGEPHHIYVYQHKVHEEKRIESGDYNDRP